MQAVQATNGAAAELLQLCAFFGPDSIPEEIIIQGVAHLGPVLQVVAANKLLLNTAIGELLKYSLIRRDTPSDTGVSLFTIHRLIQEVQKNAMDPEIQRLWAERAVKAVSHLFFKTEPGQWHLYQALLPHVQVSLKLIKEWHMTFPLAEQLQEKMST